MFYSFLYEKMLFSIVAAGLLLLLHKSDGVAMGPWIAIIDKIEGCPNENKDTTPPLLLKVDKTGKISRTVTEGTFNAEIGISNDFQLIMRVVEFKNGRWDVVANKNMGPACLALDTWIKDTYRLLLEKSGLESYNDGSSLCAKPGKGDMAVPFELTPVTIGGVPSFFYGTYRAEMVYQTLNNTVFACSAIYANVIPKQIVKG